MSSPTCTILQLLLLLYYTIAWAYVKHQQNIMIFK
jgi:hypothetical protein